MRARQLGGTLVTALVTALLLALVPATAAQAAGTGEQNWCAKQGIASAEATRAIEAACAEWRKGTWYSWGGGHAAAPGPTYGVVDFSSLESIAETHKDPVIKGLDCSGFVRWAWYQALGTDLLGRGNTKMMYNGAGSTYQRVLGASGGKPAVEDLEPGDLVFTAVDGTVDRISHVMLYLGDGYVVEEYQSQTRARVIDINSRIDRGRLVGAVRMPQGGQFTQPEPWDASLQATWGTGIAVKTHPNLSATVVTRLAGPELVRAKCQQHAERVTADGYTNDAWTYLADRRGWISNIYLKGPAWLPDVPTCTGADFDPDIGPGGGGNVTQGTSYGTWGTNVAIMPSPSTSGTALTRLPAPTTVKIGCQVRGQSVTSDGYTNDAWSYLPTYGGWVTNIYVKGAAWLAGVPACDGKGTSTPSGAKPHSTWGTDVAIHSYPSLASAAVARLSGPTSVAVSCQKRASTVTEAGYTNNAWSYLPEYQGWITNIYMKGDAWLAGVPDCGSNSGSTTVGCTDGSAPDSAGARSPRTATVWGRSIELRYSDTTECAWGRIGNGSVGDEVWVDRSVDGGKSWDKLGYTRITSGRDVFTPQFNDHAVVMRACGKAGDRVEIACTGWF
ncbi:NlpC/P60 family protein [Streptomyces sp. NPDC002992]|uniref:NlpC/P60 family protein n=1 Tax=Streptomyces sp. NPDC002992 TaxID=3154273 RepID=UPI0033AE1271